MCHRNQILLVWFQVDRIAGGNGNVYGLTFSGFLSFHLIPDEDWFCKDRSTETTMTIPFLNVPTNPGSRINEKHCDQRPKWYDARDENND
ncbi:hypothetical protein MAR_020191 [Mya arenaria]|uniref:Uncharacterized protein n=1 Tax=Mya arenaria TaxID=6604 RepID=A0ABY7E476_MYAAR|nr:hypothetical protein MAR_020191 [Mya arenaria]